MNKTPRCHALVTRTLLPLILATASGELAGQQGAVVTRPSLLPHAISSFGATRVGGWLYVYGGHIGRAHAHSRENVIGNFQRLNLADGTSWQALPPGPPLQGTALVAAADGRLYRVGGTDARNEKGDDADMHSTASVQRFDPALGRWAKATPLPEPRSSHDAIICDNKLYVVGGWHLAGDGDGLWHETAWVADLAQEPLEWRALPAIGETRRACAVATFGGRIAVLGGIDDSRPINTVRVFDPASNEWSEGPALPGFAFGTAALGIDGWLYATVMDGRLLKWNGKADSRWQPVAQFETPRFFHRMVEAPENGRILAFGGAGRGGHMRTMETVVIDAKIAAATKTPTLNRYEIPAPSQVAYRQGLLLTDNTIWAFGGNRKNPGERFVPAQFATDIWKVELTTMTARMAGHLPAGRQSMATANWGGRRENVILGGLGVVDDQVRSLASGFRWDARRRKLVPFEAELPAPRTQFQTVTHDHALYAIGGVDFTPGPRGGKTQGDTTAILRCDLKAEKPSFAECGITLPRPRRSFGAAMIGSRMYLIGGLGNGFQHAGPNDVFDFGRATWSELESPLDWVSAQVATIGSRLYVACGGTMKGMKFTQDRALWSFEPKQGWTKVVDELPFGTRHVRMLSNRNRLVFYSANDARRDRIVIHTYEPDRDTHVIEASFHR
ncbi:MAG: hypothetical protein NXI31_10415 [bacterium]|nr:hypothetical protein [bacterium]